MATTYPSTSQLKRVAEPYFRMNDRRFAREIQYAVRRQDSKAGMAREGVEMALFKLITGTPNMVLQRFVAVPRRVRQDGNFRVSVEQILAALAVIKAGHHQDHAVRQIDIVRTQHRMEELDHRQKNQFQ